MKEYNILQAIYMSFYSRNLYRDVASNWGGKTFLYLFMLVCLSWIWIVVQIQQGLNTWYSKESGTIVTQIPVLTIKEGKISTPDNRPYVITAPETHENIATIDVTGQYTTLEQAKTPILVTKDTIITQSSENEVKIYQIPNTVNMVVNPQTINERVRAFEGYVWIPVFIFFVIGAFFYRILQSLVYAVIGMIFSSVTRAKLTYGQLVKIAIVALTPPMVFSFIFETLNVTFPYMNLFYFIIAMLYLLYGILSNKKAVAKE
jgi:hypothetical protein